VSLVGVSLGSFSLSAAILCEMLKEVRDLLIP
jgi:hypothetical protein